jgi:hypothetical protein
MRNVMGRAMRIWFQMDADERYAIRFGVFPAKRVQVAEAEGYDSLTICKALAELARQNAGDPLES